MNTEELYLKGVNAIKKTSLSLLIATILMGSSVVASAAVPNQAFGKPLIVDKGVPIEQEYPVANAKNNGNGIFYTKNGIIKTDLTLPETVIESRDLKKVIDVYANEGYEYSSTSASVPDGLTDKQTELYNRIANINNDELYLALHSEKGEEDLVDVALDELGVIFDESSDSTPYGRWYYNNVDNTDDFPGAAWCAMYVSYNLNKLDANVPMYAAVSFGENNFRNEAANGNGEWHDAYTGYIPKRGDIFITNEHTGIVMAANSECIYTIEGNTSDDVGNYVNGCVNTKKRSLSFVDVGFYTPNLKVNENGLEKSESLINSSADYSYSV